MIKYSIIMPVYNVENYLQRSIESIINQDYSHWELILINDGSEDSSGDICDQYSAKYKNIKTIHQKNCGSGVARQKGLNLSSGDFICFVDPDDYLSKNSLRNLSESLEKYDADIVAFGYTVIEKDKMGNITNNIENYSQVLYLNQNDFRLNFELIEETSARALWNKIYKRTFLEKNEIKFTNQRVGQDALFNYVAFRYVTKVLILDKNYYVYDATREGSAIKKYNVNKWDYELNIVNEFNKMFEEWNLSEKYSSLKNREVWYAVFNQVVNLSVSTCPLTFSDKKKKLYSIRNNQLVLKMYKEMDYHYISKTLQNTLFFLLKYRQLSLTLLVMDIYNRLFLKN